MYGYIWLWKAMFFWRPRRSIFTTWSSGPFLEIPNGSDVLILSPFWLMSPVLFGWLNMVKPYIVLYIGDFPRLNDLRNPSRSQLNCLLKHGVNHVKSHSNSMFVDSLSWCITWLVSLRWAPSSRPWRGSLGHWTRHGCACVEHWSCLCRLDSLGKCGWLRLFLMFEDVWRCLVLFGGFSWSEL